MGFPWHFLLTMFYKTGKRLQTLRLHLDDEYFLKRARVKRTLLLLFKLYSALSAKQKGADVIPSRKLQGEFISKRPLWSKLITLLINEGGEI